MQDDELLESIRLSKKLDSSYTLLKELIESNPTREQVAHFMEEHPGLISYVPREKSELAHKKLVDKLKADPIGKKFLEDAEALLKSPPDEGAKK